MSKQDTRLDGGKRIGRKVATLMFAFMLVFQASVGGAAAVETADPSAGDKCSTLDSIVYDAYKLGNFLNLNTNTEDNPCSTQYKVNSVISDMESSDAEQTKTDIYSAALNQKSMREVGTAIQGNYINDSKTVAWSKAEVVIAQQYQNDSTEVDARIAANETIEDYYSRQQLNLIKRWNASISAYATLDNQSRQESGIDDTYVNPVYDDQISGVQIYDSNAADLNGTVTRSVTLVNGTTVDVRTVAVDTSSDGVIYPTPATEKSYTNIDGDGGDFLGYAVKPPTSDYERTRMLDWTQAQKQWNNIESANSDVKTDVDPYVTSTYSAYKDGRLEPRDVMSRQTKMFEFGTDGASANASMYDSIAALSAMGLQTPDLNKTGMMTVEYAGGQTVTGVVMAHHAPNGTWRTDTTYDASNISGPVWVASSEGEEVELTGEFTITEMTNTQGEDVTHVDTTRYNYQTAQISELQEKLNRLLELRQEIEAREPDTTSGGASSGNQIPFGLTTSQFVLAVLGGVFVLFALKDVLLKAIGLYSP